MPDQAINLELQAAAPATQPRVLIAFVVLAALAGPAASFVNDPTGLGVQSLGTAGMATASCAAGLALLGVAALRRERLPRRSAWLALLALLAPQWLQGLLAAPGIHALSLLHTTPWGVAFLIALAAPLWLGLLSALQLVQEEAPRIVAGASIAGIAAFCLAIPGGAYTVTLKEIPVAALHLLLGILAVLSWSYARARLSTTGPTATAGGFLLLTALGTAATIPLTGNAPPVTLDWHEALLPLLLAAFLSAASWWLWFWLLQRMTLAAFGMRALAAWTAAILPGFVLVSLTNWRNDAAFTIAVAALIIALRARTTDEQPLALGLANN